MNPDKPTTGDLDNFISTDERFRHLLLTGTSSAKAPIAVSKVNQQKYVTPEISPFNAI
jgi:hypothetical protein